MSGRDGEYTDGFSYGFFDELFKYKNITPDDLISEDNIEENNRNSAVGKKENNIELTEL